MADTPKKVGVYDTGDAAGAAVGSAGTLGSTTARSDTMERPQVSLEKTGRSGATWWVAALIILAVVAAVVMLT